MINIIINIDMIDLVVLNKIYIKNIYKKIFINKYNIKKCI